MATLVDTNEPDGIIHPLEDGRFAVYENNTDANPVIVSTIEEAVAVLGFDCGCGG